MQNVNLREYYLILCAQRFAIKYCEHHTKCLFRPLSAAPAVSIFGCVCVCVCVSRMSGKQSVLLSANNIRAGDGAHDEMWHTAPV